MAEFGGHPFYNCRNCLKEPFKMIISSLKLIKREEKRLIYGVYTIANIYCSKCGQELGWHYLRAHDLKNRCKEGNFIIEKLKMLKGNTSIIIKIK
ncbi:hypothetical protein ACOSQ2_031754 [Xanthoceras sorbifolium]